MEAAFWDARIVKTAVLFVLMIVVIVLGGYIALGFAAWAESDSEYEFMSDDKRVLFTVICAFGFCLITLVRLW